MIFFVAKQFTDAPGPRYRRQGKFSGQEFREDFLEQLFKQFQSTGEVVHLDLDGAYGYPTSFLEEAFGGLARQYSADEVLKAFDFIANEQPGIVDEIKNDIQSANA